jgi:hypothetical protein
MKRMLVASLVTLAALPVTGTHADNSNTINSKIGHCLKLRDMVAPAGDNRLIDNGMQQNDPYFINATFTPTTTHTNSSIQFERIDDENYVTLALYTSTLMLKATVNGAVTVLATANYSTTPSHPAQVHIHVSGTSVEVYDLLTGASILTARTPTYPNSISTQFHASYPGVWNSVVEMPDREGDPSGPLPESGPIWSQEDLTHAPVNLDGRPYHAHFDVRQGSQFYLDFLWTITSGPGRGWITFREKDSLDFQQIDIHPDYVALLQRIKGTFYERARAAVITDTAHPDHWRLIENGSTFTLINLDTGANLLTWTDPYSRFPTGQNISLYTQSGTTSVWGPVAAYDHLP